MAEGINDNTALQEDGARAAPSRTGATVWLTFVLALPVTAIAAIAVLLGQIGIGVVIAVALPVIGGLAILAWLHVGEVQAIDIYMRNLIDQADVQAVGDAEMSSPVPLPPTVSGGGMDRLAGLGRQLARAYRRRVHGLAGERGELAAVAETIADPLILVGRDRRVRLDNRASRQRFGHTLIERDLADGIRDPAVLGTVDSVLAGGEAKTIVLDSLPPPALHRPARRAAD
ncbi:MAG: hypothetical protein AAFW76_11710, partial [Pseudomonadota bacterium]